MAIVNLINKVGLSTDKVEDLLKASNTLIPIYNLRSNIRFERLSSTGSIKVLDWFKVSQNRALRPFGNVIGNMTGNSAVKYFGCHLNFNGQVDVPVYDVSLNKTVVNDLLATAIAFMAKEDLQQANVYMKTFFMLRSMYYEKNVEYTQIKTLERTYKNYLL